MMYASVNYQEMIASREDDDYSTIETALVYKEKVLNCVEAMGLTDVSCDELIAREGNSLEAKIYVEGKD